MMCQSWFLKKDCNDLEDTPNYLPSDNDLRIMDSYSTFKNASYVLFTLNRGSSHDPSIFNLQSSSTTKFLDVWLERFLSLQSHVTNLLRKAPIQLFLLFFFMYTEANVIAYFDHSGIAIWESSNLLEKSQVSEKDPENKFWFKASECCLSWYLSDSKKPIKPSLLVVLYVYWCDEPVLPIYCRLPSIDASTTLQTVIYADIVKETFTRSKTVVNAAISIVEDQVSMKVVGARTMTAVTLPTLKSSQNSAQ
ncbi:hypothetical protein J6590_067813 [Homalodisca vitripennis]|nr:hypothetical protein J6590_067813 [Homalodisca vitripennis]